MENEIKFEKETYDKLFILSQRYEAFYKKVALKLP